MDRVIVKPWYLQQGPPEQTPAAQFVLLVDDASGDVVFSDATEETAIFVTDNPGD